MAERVRLLDTLDQDDPRHAAELLEIRHTEWLLALGSGRLLEALAVARQISDDSLLGAHPYRPAAKLIPPLVLLGRFDEALALILTSEREEGIAELRALGVVTPRD